MKIFGRAKESRTYKRMTKRILVEGKVDCSLIICDTKKKGLSWRDKILTQSNSIQGENCQKNVSNS